VDRTPVEGVYAAGACASNIAVDGEGYSSGTQLGEASFFGRRAGRHAASRGREDVTQVTSDSFSTTSRPDGPQEESWA
jgi:succinate dehydrogenase/fumarate reductase flavoprotein subunit